MEAMRAADPLFPLLDAAREGDDAAMTELVRRTQPEVWRLCVALGSRTDAEDLVQDTYLRAMSAAPRFRGDASVRTWLLTIARNTCADHVRRNQRQRRLLRAVRAARPEAEVRDPRRHTHQLLDLLSEERREAFVLTQLLGLSYEEAAETLGCPIGTVRSRVARARGDLLAAEQAAQAL